METLWQKIQFWKRKMPKLDDDFVLVTVNSENDSTFPTTLAVQLLVDKYKDILYYYENAKFEVVNEQGMLTFDYSILDDGGHDQVELKADHEFKTLLGDILVEITTTFDRDKIETRENDTEESDLQ